MLVGLVSEDGSMDGNDLMDYMQSNLEKVVARVPGVGEVEEFGSQYAMRIWLNPDKLTDYSLTVDDVVTALSSYNVEVSAGQFGGAPAMAGQRLNVSIVVQSLLKTPDEFAAIPVRVNPDGSIVRIRDVGRTELGTEAYDIKTFFNGKPSAAMAIRQIAGANALNTADAVKARLKEMSRYFPPGMKVVYPYDTTPLVRVAIDEVVKTLFEAILLVFLIMWLFMGNIRATLIPDHRRARGAPGTFGVLGLFGFSINMLTMFAMVALHRASGGRRHCVVENVERIMSEKGFRRRMPPASPWDRSRAPLSVSACALGGLRSHGLFRRLDRRHLSPVSLTIIAAMLLSVLVALILTPSSALPCSSRWQRA